MHKIQVQLPDPLHRNLRKLSKELDYSIAELIRRGAEQIVSLYPHVLQEDEKSSAWRLPEPAKLGMKKIQAEELKQLAYSRE